MNKRLSKGFTLIELMVTVIILSIIVAIAYPAYTNYTTQTRRSDAQVALTQTANRLEKYFSTCDISIKCLTKHFQFGTWVL